MDVDALIDRLNELCGDAQLPAYKVTRTQPEGNPLTAAEFNAASTSAAYLAANAYVSNGLDPASAVGYAAVNAATDADVTATRLRALERAIKLMLYVRKPLGWSVVDRTVVTITHPTFSEANANAAFAMLATYWGQTITTDDTGFHLVAVRDAGASEPPTHFVRFKHLADGSLEVRAVVVNARPAFDFTPYAGALDVGAFGAAGVCSPETTAAILAPPDIALLRPSDEFEPPGKWRIVDEIDDPAVVAGTNWVGNPTPDATAAPTRKPIGDPWDAGTERVISWRVNDAAVLIQMPQTTYIE